MSRTVWQEILIQGAGPLVGAIVGTLIIGLFVQWTARRAQDSRTVFQLRHELITQMTEAANTLYTGILMYSIGASESGQKNPIVIDLRKELHQHYKTSRISGRVIEARLEAYFISDDPRLYWHRTMDLLAVRYCQCIGQLTDRLVEEHFGPNHTGLDPDQLGDEELVIKSYKKALSMAIDAVLSHPIPTLTKPRTAKSS